LQEVNIPGFYGTKEIDELIGRIGQNGDNGTETGKEKRHEEKKRKTLS
jgi:hypothetical protein